MMESNELQLLYDCSKSNIRYGKQNEIAVEKCEMLNVRDTGLLPERIVSWLAPKP